MSYNYFVFCKVYFENNESDIFSSIYNIDEKINTVEVFRSVEEFIKKDVKVTTVDGSIFKARRVVILDFKLL